MPESTPEPEFIAPPTLPASPPTPPEETVTSPPEAVVEEVKPEEPKPEPKEEVTSEAIDKTGVADKRKAEIDALHPYYRRQLEKLNESASPLDSKKNAMMVIPVFGLKDDRLEEVLRSVMDGEGVDQYEIVLVGDRQEKIQEVVKRLQPEFPKAAVVSFPKKFEGKPSADQLKKFLNDLALVRIYKSDEHKEVEVIVPESFVEDENILQAAAPPPEAKSKKRKAA